jgi:hypothetical protein
VRREAIAAQNDGIVLADASPDMSEGSDAVEYDEDIQTIQITTGDKTELKKIVCSLLLTLLKTEKEYKTTLDKPYSEISKRMRRTKEQEKKSITDFLENMEKDERKIEDMLKKFKMGRWNVGLQKGLVQYDGSTYNANRDANMARLYEDLAQNELENIQMADMDAGDLAAADEERYAEEYDNEGNDIAGLDEDYGDGAYYMEDVDREFGYDD